MAQLTNDCSYGLIALNFRLRQDEIIGIDFDDTTKWGMGAVPYSGRLHCRLSSGQSRECILLGYQDGEQLRRDLLEMRYGRKPT